jgi:IS5 family transposase
MPRLIAAPSSTKNSSGERDPEMHQTKKGNQWHFGMKAHIGVDADSGLVHTVVGTAANVNDVTQAHALVHGEETDVFADAGYQGVEKREEVQEHRQSTGTWPCARASARHWTRARRWVDRISWSTIKARIRAKVEHPFRVIKRQFGHVKVRYRGLAKNTAQLHTLFALSNLWMVRDEAAEPGGRRPLASVPARHGTAVASSTSPRRGSDVSPIYGHF